MVDMGYSPGVRNFRFQMNAKRKLSVGKSAARMSFILQDEPFRQAGATRSPRVGNNASVINPIYGVVVRALDYVDPGLEG